MIKNKNKKNMTKVSENAFIDQIKSALFEKDNSEYRDIVDKIMDKTGETAAEIASALVGLLLENGNTHNSRVNSTKAKPPSKPAVNSPKKAEKKASSALSAKTHSKSANSSSGKPAAKQSPSKKPASNSVSSLMISAGKNKKLTHKDIVGSLIARTGINAEDIVKIRINERQSIVSVASEQTGKILSAMNTPNGKIKGVPVKIQIVKDRKKSTKNASE